MNKKLHYCIYIFAICINITKTYSQTTAPVLFISTGTTSNITEQNNYTSFLKKWANINLTTKPSSIVFITYSWYTNESLITASPNPEVMHNFANMPDDYYKTHTILAGNPDLAQSIIKQIKPTKIYSETERGIDSESWTILNILFPNDKIPVCQFSINKNFSTSQHYKVAQALQQFRDENVLFICIGNIVYNPKFMHNNRDAALFNWTANFDEYTKKALDENNIKDIINYRLKSPDAKQAVEYNQQFIPLIYAIGLKNKSESVNYIYEGFQNASISLRSFMYK